MMVVVHRRPEETKGCSFISHVYAPAEGAQVAIIDAYGSSTNKVPKLNIYNGLTTREVEFGSGAGLTSGGIGYTVSVAGEDKVDAPYFRASAGGDYVVIRTGWDAALRQGNGWPMKLIAYPGGVVTTTTATTTTAATTTVTTTV